MTGLRAHLRSKWLWIGVALSLLIFLPNAIWQWQHQFISLDFLRHIHARDVRIGRTKDFFPDQVKLAMLAFPIALVGLVACFRAFDRRFRVLGWMFVIALVILAAVKGRGYYLCGAYPPLFAAGAVWLTQARVWRHAAFRALTYAALLADVAIVVALVLPVAPIGSGLFSKAIAVNGDLVEEIGWPDLTATVAGIRDSLPEDERAGLAILTGNYGEAGALTLYGPKYNLPPVISGINSFGLRGYGDPPPQRLIVLGIDRDFLDEHFSACRVIGHTPNPYDVENEETRDHPHIYLCGPPKRGWVEFWEREFPWFG
jgi:4-amino-4-deoxy-L-arabinose transferase-like glycosyltransferase